VPECSPMDLLSRAHSPQLWLWLELMVCAAPSLPYSERANLMVHLQPAPGTRHCQNCYDHGAGSAHPWKQEICKACSGLRWLRRGSVRMASRRSRGCRVGRSRHPSWFLEPRVAILSNGLSRACTCARHPSLAVERLFGSSFWPLAARSSPLPLLLCRPPLRLIPFDTVWALLPGKASQIGKASRPFPRSSTEQVPLPLRPARHFSMSGSRRRLHLASLSARPVVQPDEAHPSS
jgi:hypothetical protein